MNFLHTLQWRIVLSYTALIVISMGALSVYMVNFVQGYYIANLEKTLVQQTGLIGKSAAVYLGSNPNIPQLRLTSQSIGTLIEARVTILDTRGTVLIDTWKEPSSMDNHLSRSEVQDALRLGIGKATRVSETVGQEMLYTAAPIMSNGKITGIARVAVPTTYLKHNTDQIITTISISALVVTLLSLTLGYLLARRTSRSVHSMTEAAIRLSSGDLNQHVEAMSSDETKELAKAFNRMSEALRKMVGDLSIEKNKLSTVLDTMADGVIVLQTLFYFRPGEGIIELINPAAEQLLALRSGVTLGARFIETINNPDLQALVSDALSTNKPQTGEVELTQPRRYLSAIATPLSRDHHAGVLITLHDLTQTRQVDATRRQFVSNASHEIRSPLASIKAMAETLEDGAIEETSVAKEFVSRIHRDIDRMTNIVNDLLELSLLESNQANLTSTPMDITGLLTQIRGEFWPQCKDKSISLTLQGLDSIPHVLAEKARIHQVLLNLLNNALKFTPEGGSIHIHIESEGNVVKIEVSDTGIGIPEEHQPHIFERFYRVDSSRTYQGTGLGLSIAKHIIEFYGGAIWVTSIAGNGSKFSFTLPTHSSTWTAPNVKLGI